MAGINRTSIAELTYPELASILEELEISETDQRIWELALKTDKPFETYQESASELEQPPPVPIDSLPNKDWLRAT